MVHMIIPILDLVLLPGMTHTFDMRHMSQDTLDKILSGSEEVIALPLKEQKKISALEASDFYKIGAQLEVINNEKTENGTEISVNVQNLVEATNLSFSTSNIDGDMKQISEEIDLDTVTQQTVLNKMKATIEETINEMDGKNFEELRKTILSFTNINELIGYTTLNMPLTTSERYQLMATASLKERSLIFIDFLIKTKESIKIQVEMANHFSNKSNKNYRESILREQLRIIQKELGEGEVSQKKGYKERIEEALLPENAKAIALEEFSRLESQSPSSSDYHVIQKYLDFILELPWKVEDNEDISIAEARRVLDEQHYGLEKVKSRIIQHLAVMQLKKDKKGSIILLVGPPGTGKTSLGKSIAEALGRKYTRLSLGGVKDEAQIRGHRRTYVGALPGNILKSIKDAGTTNPVMILDEVDKLMAGYGGDPASALLEVLDPEQNNTFTDHYLDIPYDLSKVLFIATANSMEKIPRPLLDRMEIIPITSYTATEKFHIGKNHLIRKSLEEHGLTRKDVIIEDTTLQTIISDYTMEAGVRNLKKQLDALARTAAEKVVANEIERPYIISTESLSDILGKKVSRHEKAQTNNPPGVVTGLAWTPVGGEILFIEATALPGKGTITLTGKLGDVMKESAKISLSLLKSRLPVNVTPFKEKDLHIHVPSGAVPKDGPSAGIALFTALASLVTGIPVNGQIAMTGEITLRGVVMPIGGLKEKLIAAHRAGIKKALIPIDNEIDLKDVPDEVKEDIEIISVETIEDVLRETLNIRLPKANTISWLNQDEMGGYFLS
jgi:ATP-dependent Lon protease